MPQYIFVSASSFGNGHNDNPTYTFSVGSGTIFLSGSGGYVNNPTGITKATLDNPGVFLELSDENITYVTCSVDSGFNCAGTIKYVTWTPAPSPTPTSTPPATSFASIEVEDTVDGIAPTYRAVVAIEGFKTMTIDGVGMAGVNQIPLFITGTVTGNGTITVTRINPDGTADEDGYVEVTGLGCTINPSGQSAFTTGQTVNKLFNVTNFSHGDSVGVYVLESNGGEQP